MTEFTREELLARAKDAGGGWPETMQSLLAVIDKHQAALNASRRETAHWIANATNMAKHNQLIRGRQDIPLDRLKEIDQLKLAAAGRSDDQASTWRHVKTGGLYRLLRVGKLEACQTPVAVYVGVDALVWVRPCSEFFDGRFEEVSQ